MSIATNILFIRKKYGLSQTQLAEIAGVSDKAVSTWERSEKNPRMGALEKISLHFKIPKSVIIDGDLENFFLSSPIEQRILENCRLINSEGKKKLLGYSLDLLGNPKYSVTGREPGSRIAAYGATGTEEDIQPPIEEITT